jgi:DNA (cytosine-5)-methyltransferase 1
MIRLFEMFSGYGGASWGLKKAEIPYELIGYSEIDKYATQIFEQNFPDAKGKNYGDCNKIDTSKLPDFDLLTGGFPCQDVSSAGNRDLSKGRTNLYMEILRIAKDKKPKYIVLENVKGLLSMDLNENSKAQNLLINKIVREIKALGYGVVYKLLNSKDYGVPQNRERVWFVCKLGGWEFMEFLYPEKEKLKIFVKDILEKDVDKKYYLSQKMLEAFEKRKNQDVRQPNILFDDDEKPTNTITTRSGGRYQDNFIVYKKHRANEIREYPNISPCLTESHEHKGGTNAPFISSILSHQPVNTFNPKTFLELTNQLRKLTPRECFRIMGFLKDEIKIDGISDSQLYKLAGNGWDINLVSKIFKRMFPNEVK